MRARHAFSVASSQKSLSGIIPDLDGYWLAIHRRLLGLYGNDGAAGLNVLTQRLLPWRVQVGQEHPINDDTLQRNQLRSCGRG